MASPRIEYAVLPAGDGPGQDRCFTADGLVVVLDGASAYDPSVSPDASEYVDTLGPALVEQITSRPGIDLREALGDAIRYTADELVLVPGKGPSSTVSVVRWGEAAVDVLVLGDSPVVVRCSDGAQRTIVQHPMDHIAPELRRRYRERLAIGKGYDAEHRAILAQIQREEAPLRNRPDGFFIAEADPIASNWALCRRWCSNFVDRVLVATDGVDISELNIDSESGSATLLERLNALTEWERREDPEGTLRPRSKRHDDKTIAVLTRVDGRRRQPSKTPDRPT